jgi:hypothetical protein
MDVPVAELPLVDGLFRFDCPRCHQPASERFYGPCAPCRAELNEKFYRAPGSVPGPAPTPYEPKMNVVPNFVATKDDFDDGPDEPYEPEDGTLV